MIPQTGMLRASYYHETLNSKRTNGKRGKEIEINEVGQVHN